MEHETKLEFIKCIVFDTASHWVMLCMPKYFNESLACGSRFALTLARTFWGRFHFGVSPRAVISMRFGQPWGSNVTTVFTEEGARIINRLAPELAAGKLYRAGLGAFRHFLRGLTA